MVPFFNPSGNSNNGKAVIESYCAKRARHFVYGLGLKISVEVRLLSVQQHNERYW